jgi:ParB family chromosome partitioning protein
MKAKKKALGRGLNAILESPDTDITSRDISGNYVVGAIADIPVKSIESNPFQPRDKYEEESLNDLADSIKEQGIIQPVTVRKLGYDKYQLISGERRLKAAKLAGLELIPAYIRVANDQQMLEMALVENIQREELNPIEIAIGYQRLVEECKLTQEQLSEKVGKKRSTITNYLRLLKLPVEIQVALRDVKITMGHARALVNVEDPASQKYLLELILEKDISVREVEKLVRNLHSDPLKKFRKTVSHPLPVAYETARDSLSEQLKTKVKVTRNNRGRGNIVIPFKTDEEFRKIINLITESRKDKDNL